MNIVLCPTVLNLLIYNSNCKLFHSRDNRALNEIPQSSRIKIRTNGLSTLFILVCITKQRAVVKAVAKCVFFNIY